MYKERKRNNIIIISLLVIVFIMAGAYSAFSSQLNIKGSSKVTSNWDIEITNITDGISTGTAENASSPSYTALTASMEANLYSSGDSMEYDVTISNKGTLDAKLDDITTNLANSNSDAVIITFSGYTKGEKLLVGENKVIKVKIEYNSSYTGEEISSEVEINFDYVQNNNETEPSSNTYLLTYDCTTNGGKSCINNNEYLVSNSNVDLSKKGSKDKYIFVGWNTNKDATSSLESYTMPESDSTLYAVFREENVNLTLSTTATTKSITVVASASATSGISKYEYSKDNGSTWVIGSSNTYTFSGLTQNTSYNIKVRVTSGVGKQTIVSKTQSTSSVTKPTFSESSSTTSKTIKINYPSGCGSTYTCTYQKNSESAVTVTSTSASVSYTSNGSLVAKVTDGTNAVSSSYTVKITAAIMLRQRTVTTGSGLYKDSTDSSRYIYRGASPNNYIKFNNETWRILSVESDNTIKIIKNASIGTYAWNSNGSNDWSNSTIKTYLNGTYLNSISTTYIVNHSWNVGKFYIDSSSTLNGDISQEKATIWNGKVGLMNITDYVKASTNSNCTSVTVYCRNSSCYGNGKNHNWIYSFASSLGRAWFINGWINNNSSIRASTIFLAETGYPGALNSGEVKNKYDTIPSVYLNSNISLSGNGTSSSMYTIN